MLGMKIVFADRGWEDFTYWVEHDRKIAARIVHGSGSRGLPLTTLKLSVFSSVVILANILPLPQAWPRATVLKLWSWTVIYKIVR